MMMWEYKTVIFKTSSWTGKMDVEEVDSKLNELGKENWELVISDGASLSKYLMYTFKRPLE